MTATSTTAEESSKQDDELPESSEVISYDECFDLLSNHRRRYVLHYLQQNGDTATLSDLAEQIAAWENGIEITDLTYDQRKRVYTSLQQVHLPRMDDAHVIEFDDREGSIEIGPAADNLDIYLEIVEGGDIPWSYLYLGLALINTVVVGAFAAGLWPVAALPGLGVPIFVTTSFLVTSVVHLYITRTEMRLGGSEEPPSRPE
ncbi:MAG: hypothetical protein V5A32_07810 [Halovenus sp.]